MLRYNLSHPSWWLRNCWDTFLWWCVCSILRDGLALCLFHPSRWFGFRSSEGQELLVLKASSPSQALVSPRVVPSRVVCKYFWEWLLFLLANLPRSHDFVFFARHGLWRKAAVFLRCLPPPLQSCSEDFCSKYFLVCDIHFWLSQRFHGCGSSRVVSPLVF